MRFRIKRVLQHPTENESVTLFGWVKSKRVSKSVSFLMINDGSCLEDLQIIVSSNTDGTGIIDQIGTGAAVRVDGVMRVSQGKGQDWEIHADRLELVGFCDPESYPLQKKGHSLEFLRELSHLRGRTNTFGAVFRIRNTLARLIHEFFQKKDFLWVHTPIITASDCEGAGQMFQVTTLGNNRSASQSEADDFFGKNSYLTVSGQLNGEALALSVGDVYTFGPTFRAENSNTSRHLAEFWMVEPEMAFADLRDDAHLAEEFLHYVIGNALTANHKDLEFLSKHYEDCDLDRLQQVAQMAFTRVSYTDAVDILKKAPVKFEFPVNWGSDLQSEHERYLAEVVFKGPVIVMDYPKDIKAFYMRLNGDGKTVAAMDVLVPRVGELIGGSQREDRKEVLLSRCEEMGVNIADMTWYTDLRVLGGCPHAGFGLGFERLVQYVTGMSNIRDVIPFARTPGSIKF